MNRLLVTGARGQLGSDCCEVLKDNYEITAVDLPEVDLVSRETCQAVLEDKRPDVILNCAAFTNVDGCEAHEKECWPINAEVPGWLAKWTKENQCHLVHVSTDFVFDGKKSVPEPYVEEDLPAPLSVYGCSKRAGEEAVLRADADAAIVRTAWLYGRVGGNFLKTMLRLSLARPEKDIQVINDQFGSPTWSYDLASQLKEIMASRSSGIYHASSEGHCSWYELASRFLELMGVSHRIVPGTTAEYPTPATRPRNSILRNKRLDDANISVMRDWQAGLEEFVSRHGTGLLDEAKELVR